VLRERNKQIHASKSIRKAAGERPFLFFYLSVSSRQFAKPFVFALSAAVPAADESVRLEIGTSAISRRSTTDCFVCCVLGKKIITPSPLFAFDVPSDET
jgi:hypothetical protein